MRRHFVTAAILWIVLTIIGEVVALNANIYPLAAAEEAQVVDSAFRLLVILGLPVFTFVLAVLIYSLIRFRHRGEPTVDGPALRGSGPVAGAWLLITASLAIFVIFNPGLTGLAELRANPQADLVVKVDAARWFWKLSYPQYNITTTQELVLPVGKRVRFEITATDVVHSFWVPAFRVKIDAVPGLTTTIYLTPDKTGSFENDFNLRLQCAELCGTGHAVMMVPVRVVEQAQFDAWVAQVKAE